MFFLGITGLSFFEYYYFQDMLNIINPASYGEGYSREDGRDCIAPVKLTMHVELIKRPDVGSIYMHGSREVRMPISGSEVASNGMQPVRQVHSSDEFSVTEKDAKGSDFCDVFQTVHGYQSCLNVKGRV